MSGQAELGQRHARLEEINGIMTAMKSLSLVETRKLARIIGHQRCMLDNIAAAAADFLTFHPVATAAGRLPAILILIGSERGFCGNFNDRVAAALDTLPDWQPPPALLVVGHRLAQKLENRSRIDAVLEGPTVTEEVPAVLNRLMDALHRVSRQVAGDGVALFGLAHGPSGEPALERLLPLAPPSSRPFAHPPRLQLPPTTFFAELLDQYLLAALYGLLYGSLAAENRQRLAHMEHALERLDEALRHLASKRNALRQEKIVEEIEVILSSEQAAHHGLRRATTSAHGPSLAGAGPARGAR
jgi:F-type H+-transporting ATPase subunit gamma